MHYKGVRYSYLLYNVLFFIYFTVDLDLGHRIPHVGAVALPHIPPFDEAFQEAVPTPGQTTKASIIRLRVLLRILHISQENVNLKKY